MLSDSLAITTTSSLTHLEFLDSEHRQAAISLRASCLLETKFLIFEMSKPEHQHGGEVGEVTTGVESSRDGEIAQTSGPRLALIMVGLCLAVFLTGMASNPLPSPWEIKRKDPADAWK